MLSGDLAIRVAVEQEWRRRQATQTGASNALDPYYDDPAAFVRDCIDWGDDGGPAPYQIDILDHVVTEKRVAVRGPHGLGKTALAAQLILWFALTTDAAGTDWKAPTTASVWRQLNKYLWPEIHKWARRLRWEKIGRPPFDERTELLQMSLKLDHGEAFALASDQPGQIEGAHASAILYVFDEAKIIPDKIFDAAEGAFSGAGDETGREALALAISTPGEPNGRFYDIHRRVKGTENWWVRHVTRDEALAAGRMGREWAEQMRGLWGEQSAVYQNRVLGEFASSEEDSVIPLGWVELANQRWQARVDSGAPLPALTRVSVDVARGGRDKTVLAKRYGPHIGPLDSFNVDDTMQTAGIVNGLLAATGHEKVDAVIDVIGVGAGLYDRVRERYGSRAKAFNASNHSDAKDRSGAFGFFNRRSEGWWKLREMLDPTFGATLELPPDDELMGDLTAPRWQVVSDGKIKVESKDTIKGRIDRSTDRGDAVMQAAADMRITAEGSCEPLMG